MKIRQVAVYTAVVLGTITLVYLLYVFRQALLLFILSLAIAASARPFVDRLVARRLPRSFALILVYLLFIGFLVLLGVLTSSSIVQETQQLSDNLARSYDRIWVEWPEGNQVQQMIIRQLPAPATLYQSFSPEAESTPFQGLLGITIISAGFVAQFVTSMILSIYWSVDRVHFERLWLSLLPVESRARSRDVWRSIERDFGSYVRSEVLQSIFAALLLGVGLWLMGVNYPILLAIFAALAWLLPWLGGILVVVVIGLTAFSQSVGLGILATAYVIGVLFFLEFYMEPRFLRRRQYSSLLSILLIIALVEPFGLVGFIVAPPLAAMVELIFRYNVQARQQPAEIETVQRISELRARVIQVRAFAASRDKPLDPQTTSMLSRLETLVDKADVVLDKQGLRNKAR